MQLTKTSLDSVRWRLLYAITAWAGIATLLLATSWGDEHRNRLIWAVSDSLGLAIWALLGVALYPVLAAPWSRRGAWRGECLCCCLPGSAEAWQDTWSR